MARAAKPATMTTLMRGLVVALAYYDLVGGWSSGRERPSAVPARCSTGCVSKHEPNEERCQKLRVIYSKQARGPLPAARAICMRCGFWYASIPPRVAAG